MNNLYARMIYKSSIPSQNIGVSLHLVNDGQEFDFKYSSKFKNVIKNKNKGVVKLGIISLFTKGEMASKCPKCTPNIVELLNLSSYFNGPLAGFYFDILRQTRAGKIYDTSANEEEVEVSASDIFSLFTSHQGPKDQFQFDFIKGAREVSFEVIFCHQVPDKLTGKEKPHC